MSSETAILYFANDIDLVVDQLRVAETGVFLGSATITASILNSAGTAITGADGISLTVENADEGRYRGRVESTASLSVDGSYAVRVTISSGSYNAEFNIPAECVRRGSS